MKISNLKKLSRKEQTEIKGSLQVKKCRGTYPQCDAGECCTGDICLLSPITECDPILD